MRRLFGLFGFSVVGAIVGVLTMIASQATTPTTSRSASSPTSTSPAKVAPLPESVGDVLLAWTPEALDPTLPPAARRLAGVDAISEVATGLTNLVASHDSDGTVVDRTDTGWSIPLDTIAIDPAGQAGFASVADRAAVAGLGPGEALLGRTSATLRRLDVGGTIDFDSGRSVVVAGIVEDSTIGAAELAVDRATGRQLGISTLRYMLVAHSGDRAGVETALRRALPPDKAVRFRGLGETPYLRQGDAVLPHVRLKERFGEFAYQPPPPGEREFVQDPEWRSENLVTRDLPILGQVTCHRAVIEAIEGALDELVAANLEGCWNSRLVVAGGDLSRHAWGVAIDINYDANMTGRESQQDPRLVEVFQRWGFTWGGEWLVRDPAHFEYLQPPKPG
jgi:hypothetical protein